MLVSASFQSMVYHLSAVVIDQCALRPDLALWSAGDLSEVGEKGITLRFCTLPLIDRGVR